MRGGFTKLLKSFYPVASGRGVLAIPEVCGSCDSTRSGELMSPSYPLMTSEQCGVSGRRHGVCGLDLIWISEDVYVGELSYVLRGACYTN